MTDNGYVCLDSRAFDRFINQKQDLIRRYNEINRNYDMIVRTLLSSWQGRGANAFARDAFTVKKNITGIFDILRIMCDTLTDCREVFGECDKGLGEYNRNADVKK